MNKEFKPRFCLFAAAVAAILLFSQSASAATSLSSCAYPDIANELELKG